MSAGSRLEGERNLSIPLVIRFVCKVVGESRLKVQITCENRQLVTRNGFDRKLVQGAKKDSEGVKHKVVLCPFLGGSEKTHGGQVTRKGRGNLGLTLKKR